MNEWEKRFGGKRWNDPAVSEELIQKAIMALDDCLMGRKVPPSARKTAQFLAGRLAYPQTTQHQGITIEVRAEDIERARLKAGLSPRKLLK